MNEQDQQLLAEGRRLFLRALLTDSLSALIQFINWLETNAPILKSYRRAVGA